MSRHCAVVPCPDLTSAARCTCADTGAYCPVHEADDYALTSERRSTWPEWVRGR